MSATVDFLINYSVAYGIGLMTGAETLTQKNGFELPQPVDDMHAICIMTAGTASSIRARRVQTSLSTKSALPTQSRSFVTHMP